MTTTTTEGRGSDLPTLTEPTHYYTVESTDQVTTLGALIGSPTPCRADATWILTTLVRGVWEATPGSDDGYEQARLALSLLLHHDLNQARFADAMKACGKLYDLRMGGCIEYIYGDTKYDRAEWTIYETVQLNEAIGNMTAGIPEKVPA